MSEELKKCPFCGGPPTIKSLYGDAPERCVVGCLSKKCKVNPHLCASTQKKGIKIWNTRAGE